MLLRPPENGFFYPLRGGTSALFVDCGVCNRDGRLRWIAKHSGLEPGERASRMHSFKVIRFDDPQQTEQRRYAKTIIEEAVEKQRGLYTFWGDFGSGKTMALQIIVNELRVLGMQEGYYTSFAAVIDHLRTLFSSKQDTSAYWNRLLRVPVLALDEVSRFDDTKGWIRDRLFVLADTRYRMRGDHLTVFATNANPNASLSTEDSIGYLFSRMREGARVELGGDVRATATVMS